MSIRFGAAVMCAFAVTSATVFADPGHHPTSSEGTFDPTSTAGFGMYSLPQKGDFGSDGAIVRAGGRVSDFDNNVFKVGNYFNAGFTISPTTLYGAGVTSADDIDPNGMLVNLPQNFFAWVDTSVASQQIDYTLKLHSGHDSTGTTGLSVGVDVSKAYRVQLSDPTSPGASTVDLDMNWMIDGKQTTSDGAYSGFGYSMIVADACTGSILHQAEMFIDQSGTGMPAVAGFNMSQYSYQLMDGMMMTTVNASDSWTVSLPTLTDLVIFISSYAIGDTFTADAYFDSNFGDTITASIVPNAENPNAVITVVPEPTAAALLALGGLALARRRR